MSARILSLLFPLAFVLHGFEAFGDSPPSADQNVSRVAQELVHVQSKERPLRASNTPDPYFFYFGESVPQGRGAYPLASGFILPQGGYCVTSYRALEAADNLQIVDGARKAYDAELVGADAALDLAVIKLKGGKKFAGVDFASSAGVGIGESIIILARPLGFEFLMQRGHVSSRGDVLGTGPFNRHWMLSFPTNPSLAGAPLIDARGRVIGMATYDPKGPASMGLMLPSDRIQAAVQQIIKSGRIQRPWLGIVPRNLASVDELDHVRTEDIQGGILIENLIIDGPAAKAGLQIGDLIMKVGEKPVRRVGQLQDLLGKRKAGERINLQVYRSKKGPVTITVELDDIPSAQDLPAGSDLL